MQKKKKVKKLNKTLSYTNCTISSQSHNNLLKSTSLKGNLISYGCLNLTLTLKLAEKDFSQNNILWENLKNYKSLSFLAKNKSLWSRIKLSSTNDTMRLLLNMNMILDKKIKIKHICFRKIRYNQSDTDFKELISTVTNNNGLYLESYPICPCELSVQLRLRYKNKRRLFVISGEKTPLDDDDDEEGDYDMKEEDNILLEEGTNYDEMPGWEDMNGGMEVYEFDEKAENDEYNPFIDMPKDINNVNDFYFVFFNYGDYNGSIDNTFKGKIGIEYLYKYIIYLRKNAKNKIILNMASECDNIDLEVRDLLSIVGIVIFYDKNKLFKILNTIRNEEEKIKKEEEHFKHYYDNKLKKQEIQKYLDEEDKRANLVEYLQNKVTDKDIFESEENFLPLFRSTHINKNFYSMKLQKSQLLKENQNEDEKIIKIKDNKYFVPLTKVEMFNYYKNEICEKDIIKSKEEKMIIVLDELNKLYIVQFNQEYEKPFVLDLEIKLYEQINVHNIKKIESYKELIKNNLNEYTLLYISYLLSSLTSFANISEEAALFIGFYGGQKILKKKILLEKNFMSSPTNESFYKPDLSATEIDELILQAERRKKEIKFILDGNNKNIVKLKLYNPLLDKYALSYLNKDKNKNYFKNCGFITEQGKLLYDPVYRESLAVNKNEKKVKNEKDLVKTCRDFISKNKFKIKENECLDKYRNKNSKLNKYMIGFKQKKPWYEIYLKESKIEKLPIIKNNNNSNNNIKEFNTPLKVKSSSNLRARTTKKKASRLNIKI